MAVIRSLDEDQQEAMPNASLPDPNTRICAHTHAHARGPFVMKPSSVGPPRGPRAQNFRRRRVDRLQGAVTAKDSSSALAGTTLWVGASSPTLGTDRAGWS
jgi:hypothetical protein